MKSAVIQNIDKNRHNGRGGTAGSHTIKPTPIDAEALAADLRAQLRGEVRFDDGSRALYATDASNYRQVPIGVVIPKDVDDVIATIATCRRYSAPIVLRGGGTSLAGQTCNVAVVIDMSKSETLIWAVTLQSLFVQDIQRLDRRLLSRLKFDRQDAFRYRMADTLDHQAMV